MEIEPSISSVQFLVLSIKTAVCFLEPIAAHGRFYAADSVSAGDLLNVQ